MDEQPTLQTDRLVLRPMTLSDGPDVQRLAGDPAIADTTLRIPHPYEDGMAEAWIATQPEAFAEGRSVVFAITLRETGELIGSIGLELNPDHECGEMGYWIGRAFWSRGYATEAGRAVLCYGFATLGLNRIEAHHFCRNPASGRVLRKLGMAHEGRIRRRFKKDDHFEDVELYAILFDEFEG